MNQELLGGTGVLVGDCKTSSFNGGIVNSNPSPSLLSPSPSSSSSSIKTTTAPSHSEKQNLRCPRCDSSNTKFCYYNNYNLMQPRHFCKTCRRYWTKGGALRNIPIGGGCRKNRTSPIPTAVGKSSSANTKIFPSEIGRTGLGGNGFHQELSQNPILWGSSQNYHHLGFLRAPQKPNQAATSVGNSSSPKNDATMIGGLEAMTDVAARSVSFDSLNKSSTMGISSSFWRNNELRSQRRSGCLEGDQTHSSGTQEFHQKLKLSSGNIYTDQPLIFVSNMPSSSSSSMLISTPIAGGDLSRWNPAFSWSDPPTTNGAYL